MTNDTIKDIINDARGLANCCEVSPALLKMGIKGIANRLQTLCDAGLYLAPKEALETVAGARPLDAMLANPPFDSKRGESAAATRKRDWLELPRNITLKRYVNTTRVTHFIGQYRDDKDPGNPNPRRIYTLLVVPLETEGLAAADLPPVWEVGAHEDGKLLFKIVTKRGRAVAEYLGVKALKAWLNYCGSQRRGKQSRKTHNKRNRANRRARKAAALNPVNPVNSCLKNRREKNETVQSAAGVV